MKTWEEYTKKELLALPERAWNKDEVYEYVLFCPTRQKHDSGFNFYAVIGMTRTGRLEIAARCDDFCFVPQNDIPTMADNKSLRYGALRFDCSMHGVVRLWSRQFNIAVGHSLSSTSFHFVDRDVLRC